MRQLNGRALLLTFMICLAAAIGGTLLVGNGLEGWFATLVKPALLIPLPLFYLVGGIYYLLFGVVLYRILTQLGGQTRTVALSWAITVMVLNELWNWVLFGWQSTQAGFVGIAIFLLPVVVLATLLWSQERLAAWLVLIYAGWVVYDLAWTYQLWQLNG
ncbi:MAG: TspO/MBR family protein [Caldilineaceae bacterium]